MNPLKYEREALMDDVHLLTARHFRSELRRGGKIFSCKFGLGASRHHLPTRNGLYGFAGRTTSDKLD